MTRLPSRLCQRYTVVAWRSHPDIRHQRGSNAVAPTRNSARGSLPGHLRKPLIDGSAEHALEGLI
jgi:hypothetical protein